MSVGAARPCRRASPRTMPRAPRSSSSRPLPPASTTPASSQDGQQRRRPRDGRGRLPMRPRPRGRARALLGDQPLCRPLRRRRGRRSGSCPRLDARPPRMPPRSPARTRRRARGRRSRSTSLTASPQATEQLREDHAASCRARPSMRPGYGGCHARDGPVGLGHAFCLVERRLDRGQHVRTRVAVRDREDVQCVDLVDASVEGRRRA